MNRKALITIKTSKDGKRCLNSCYGLGNFGDYCVTFDSHLDSVVVGNTGDRFDAVRCRACVAATNRFDKLVGDNTEELREAMWNA